MLGCLCEGGGGGGGGDYGERKGAKRVRPLALFGSSAFYARGRQASQGQRAKYVHTSMLRLLDLALRRSTAHTPQVGVPRNRDARRHACAQQDMAH